MYWVQPQAERVLHQWLGHNKARKMGLRCIIYIPCVHLGFLIYHSMEKNSKKKETRKKTKLEKECSREIQGYEVKYTARLEGTWPIDIIEGLTQAWKIRHSLCSYGTIQGGENSQQKMHKTEHIKKVTQLEQMDKVRSRGYTCHLPFYFYNTGKGWWDGSAGKSAWSTSPVTWVRFPELM